MIPDKIKQAWRGSVIVPDRRPIYEWAHDNIILPNMYAQSGRFSVHPSRYMIDPFNALMDPLIREVDICKAIQTGGTITSEIAIIWWMVNDPGPIMWTFQSDPDAKEHCKSRWNPLLKRIKALQAILPQDRYAVTTTEIYFGPFFLLVNGANLNSLQSKSVRYKINDEVWLWKQGLLAEAKGRVSAFEAAEISKFVNISQAGHAKTDWEFQYKQSSQEDWGFKCTCGEPVALIRQHGEKENRAGLVWNFAAKDDSDMWNVQECAESARYVCPNCAKDWLDTDQTRSYWNANGLYIPKKEIRQHRGFTWNALVNRKMAQLVEEYTAADNAKQRGQIVPMEECLQKRFTEFTSEETFSDVIEIRSTGYKMHDYFNGDLKMEGETRRFMGVDRQINRYYVTVRAFRSDGSSRLLWGTQTQTKEQLLEIQKRMGLGNYECGLDCSYETEDGYKFCAENKWIALEGSESTQTWAHPDKTKRFYSQLQRHKTSKGLCARYLFGGEKIKDILGRWREMPEYWETPDDPPVTYVDAISMSESKKEILNKKTGRAQWKWVTISKSKNHYWDCEVMTIAVAMIRGVIGSVARKEKDRGQQEEDPKPVSEKPTGFVEQRRKLARKSAKKNWVGKW